MDLTRLGPFFALHDLDGDCWRPLRDLYDGPVLDERVAYVADVLGAMTGTPIETRVAASTMSLGLFARLVAPVIGAAVLGRSLPALDADATYWQPSSGGPWPLALTGAEVGPDLAATLDEVVLPLAEVVAGRFSLSPQVLYGNVASAVFGAVRMVGAARADLADAARTIGLGVLTGPLHGTGVLAEEFVRSSCCLYYRIPGGGYCGDCVLTAR
ncbi:MAG TPA: (2Fe-2S)-binding protein [Marmoricola sp.]|nr:(2Fe-2S)-binding protein [Marmoricola sp.]